MRISLYKTHVSTALLATLATVLVVTTPTLAGERVQLTARCRELAGDCSRAEVLEIGRKVEALYVQKYKKHPLQNKRGTNIYGVEHLPLIDKAIREVKR